MATWDSIWHRVQQHQWKYRPRTRNIDAVLWHATRGNQMYPGNIEYRAAVNWFTSPNNKITFQGGDYAGISNYLIGPGIITEVVPPEYCPAWSSWPSDEHAVSVEVTQSNYGQPIEPETIDACVEFAIWAENRWGIPRVEAGIIYDDKSWVGHGGHANTRQGANSGKTDPDSKFWVPFWEKLNKGEDEMDEARVRQIVQDELSKLSQQAGFGTGDLALALRTIWERIKKAGIGAKQIGDAFDPFKMP